MTDYEIEELLLDAGFRQSAVEQMIEEYSQMKVRFQNQEFAEVGVNMGRFCEAFVHILRLKMESKLSEDSVRKFVQKGRRDQLSDDWSQAFSKHISNMLDTVYDIRSNRDAAHMNLDTSVNKADARLGIALCSSLFVELVREFVIDDKIEDVNQIADTINELVYPVQQNSLQSLVTSRYEFDRSLVMRTIEGLILVIKEDEEIRTTPEFDDLDIDDQLIVLALGRLALYNLGFADELGETTKWFSDRVTAHRKTALRNELENCRLEEELSHGGYHIPGYKVPDAVDKLSITD